jgi:2-dehydropantoate 2-reductase
MRIGVIGSGALGLYYGALLQRAGHDLHFLLRRDFEAISRTGLSVTSPQGDFHLADIQGYKNSLEIGPVDLVLVGLKAYANEHLVGSDRIETYCTATLRTPCGRHAGEMT